MTDKEYMKLIQLAKVYPAFEPANKQALILFNDTEEGEVRYFKEVSERDLQFHKLYFKLLNYIYDLLPANFHKAVKKELFYKWLKHLHGDYNVIFEYSDGSKLIDYKSLSFGKMSQRAFENYIREQLPYIYGNVIEPLYRNYPQKYSQIINLIEHEFDVFLNQML